MSAPPALHVQPLNGPCAFLLHSWLIPCGTLLLRCIYLRFGLFMWIKGFPDPLENCLRLQRVVRGIKHSQGSLPANPRLPLSSNILRMIHSALDLNSFDDHMFWAACLLAYFGFLRSAEFNVPSLSAFDPSRHLSVRDIAVDVKFY